MRMMASSPARTSGSSPRERRRPGGRQRPGERAGVGLVEVVAEHEEAQGGERVGGRRGG